MSSASTNLIAICYQWHVRTWKRKQALWGNKLCNWRRPWRRSTPHVALSAAECYHRHQGCLILFRYIYGFGWCAIAYEIVRCFKFPLLCCPVCRKDGIDCNKYSKNIHIISGAASLCLKDLGNKAVQFQL
jgi:hypothetical protein